MIWEVGCEIPQLPASIESLDWPSNKMVLHSSYLRHLSYLQMPKMKRLQVILVTLLSEVHKERQNLTIFSVKIVYEKEAVL